MLAASLDEGVTDLCPPVFRLRDTPLAVQAHPALSVELGIRSVCRPGRPGRKGLVPERRRLGAAHGEDHTSRRLSRRRCFG